MAYFVAHFAPNNGSFPLTLRPRRAIRTIRAMDSKFEQFSKLFANYPSTQSNLSVNESAEQNGQ